MTVQYNLWDLVKGDCDRLMEVKITAIKGKKFDRLIQGDRSLRCCLIQVRQYIVPKYDCLIKKLCNLTATSQQPCDHCALVAKSGTYTKLNCQVNVAWIADLKVDLRSTKKYI